MEKEYTYTRCSIKRTVGVGVTLCYKHRLHGGDGRAVVIDVHHLDSDSGSAAEWRGPPVCCLKNQPTI